MISTPENATITFTPAKLRKFKQAYNRAYLFNQDHHSVFEFDGHEFVLGYAGYMIQYLDAQFGNKTKKH